jgi:CubicO group peptidase (beta-lactamase class C family)
MAGTTLDSDVPGGAAAAGLVGPLADLLSLAGELARPTLISAATHHAATSVQFGGIGGVLPGFQRFDPCDWGLGVEIRGEKHPHWTGTANSPATFGHFGRSGSFVWIDSVAGLLCAGLGDRPFGPWAVQSWPALADAVLGEWATIRTAGEASGVP